MANFDRRGVIIIP